MPADLHAARLTNLLKRQHGLLTLEQAVAHGLSPSAVSRSVAAGRWQRILPRVYATFVLELSEAQRVWAAVLYAGEGASITGWTALRQHRIRRLPDAPDPKTVFITCGSRHQPSSRDFVRVMRSNHPATSYLVDDVRTMPVARAVVDAAAELTTYDAALDLLTAVIHSRKLGLDEVAEELAAAPTRGSRWLRAAISEANLGSRSVAEADARALFAAAGFPPPLINEPIVVDGQLFVPDFRWGWVIVEIDSKEWHLLRPGSWEATQHRRMLLKDAGYHVIPVAPADVRGSPTLVLSVVRAALVDHLGWSA